MTKSRDFVTNDCFLKQSCKNCKKKKKEREIMISPSKLAVLLQFKKK